MFYKHFGGPKAEANQKLKCTHTPPRHLHVDMVAWASPWAVTLSPHLVPHRSCEGLCPFLPSVFTLPGNLPQSPGKASVAQGCITTCNSYTQLHQELSGYLLP